MYIWKSPSDEANEQHTEMPISWWNQTLTNSLSKWIQFAVMWNNNIMLHFDTWELFTMLTYKKSREKIENDPTSVNNEKKKTIGTYTLQNER